ncbi:peptidoglycan synthetase [marine bacterium AO1-C]|nr:peptidoglycan synthetase [marine bacterium AO1-C]
MNKTGKRIHFIAIGGSVMHNLAIELHKSGNQVTGSDDHIFDPSKSRLAQYGLLPDNFGWYPEKITSEVEAVILGMHARPDNPELKKAQDLGIEVFSFPEYLYQCHQHKKRVVIGGSHGKTTITSMIMHVLKYHQRDFDYMVGAALEGFESSVKITNEAPLAILEGDEYLSSPIDTRSKFLHYRPHIGVITGIAWDHINIFKTFDEYVKVFDDFAASFQTNGVLIYHEGDELVRKIGEKPQEGVTQVGYQIHPYRVENGQTLLLTDKCGEVPIQIMGEHNMKNLLAAKMVCTQLSIEAQDFYKAIASFKGAARRLEKVASSEQNAFFKDFAHAPSKVLATTEAVKQQFEDRRLIACVELHTFSSLNKTFLTQYQGVLNAADVAVVYFNPAAIALKQLEPITVDEVKAAFAKDGLQVFDDASKMVNFLYEQNWEATNLLMMSSGNFNNLNLPQLASEIMEKVN